MFPCMDVSSFDQPFITDKAAKDSLAIPFLDMRLISLESYLGGRLLGLSAVSHLLLETEAFS